VSAQPFEARLAHLEGAFLQVDRRLESLERTMESRFSIVDQRFNWLTGIVVASWISTVVTVLFRH
jgi:hypothetical protein